MRLRYYLGLMSIGYIGTALIMSYDTDPTWWFISTSAATVQHPFGVYGAYTAALIRYVFGHTAWLVIALSVAFLMARWRGVAGLALWIYAGRFVYVTCVAALMLTHCSLWIHGGYVGYVIHNVVSALVIPENVSILIGTLLGIAVIWCGGVQYVYRFFATYLMPILNKMLSLLSWRSSKTKKPLHYNDVQDLSHDESAVVKEREVRNHRKLRKKDNQRILEQFFTHKESQDRTALQAQCRKKAQILHEKLLQFGIQGSVVSISVGPVVVLYEYQPEQHIPLTKIVARESDLALALQVRSVRIIAPIPGKGLVGFECAHDERTAISFARGVSALYEKAEGQRVPILFGVTPLEEPVIVDMTELPHLLVAGSTGSGKSVTLHSMMMSILGTRSPEDVRCMLIDPKRLEFTMYGSVPHLLTPILHDAQQAIGALRWLVAEMDRRYKVLAEAGSKDCAAYREQGKDMPFIVVVIDELADLMMTGGKDVELLIVRIAQMARAAGIHLILATQRPSVDVITGLIKVNIPARVALRVASKIDSRTIIDRPGAEQLLGRGDMLFMGLDGIPTRMHGLYITQNEIKAVVEYVCSQWSTAYIDMAIAAQDHPQVSPEDAVLFQEVVSFVRSVDEISISFLQRKFKIGYNRSARMIDYLEAHGIILPSDGGKMRRVVR